MKAKRIARRPTRDQYRNRITLTRQMVAARLSKSEIKAALRERFGDLSARTIERYVARARA